MKNEKFGIVWGEPVVPILSCDTSYFVIRLQEIM